ncbi:MAG: zinc ribbon domain-containing protein [Acidobacteria bacterium]|nr:zinc ribbon domain-containing protein [Acidobacteriota bacterium]
MPIFEYRCSNCNHVFEELVLNRREAKVECPSCGQTHVKQLVSRFTAQTGSRSASDLGECFNRSAGLCQAGGGPIT